MRFLLFASLIALPSTALSQAAPPSQDAPTTLPPVVVTATRIPTLVERIPAGVTVIDRATIEQRGYTTLVEALAAVPGLQIVQSGGPGGNGSVFIRGTNSNHVLVLRDGVPVNDPSDPGGLFNFGVDTLADIDRIEVVRGPMSSLYGSGAIGGVINLITKPGSGKPHGTVEAAAGLPRAVLGAATLAGRSGAFDYNLAAEGRSDQGSDTTPRRLSIYNGNRNGYTSNLGSVELGYTPAPGTRLSFLLRGRSSDFNLDELGFPAYDARSYRGHDETAFGRLGGTTQLFDGAWETGLFASHAVNDRNYVQDLEAGDPNVAFGNSKYHGARTDVQWNNTVHLPDLSWSRDGAVLFGYEHISDSARSRVDTSSGGFGFQSSVNASDSSDAGHVGAQSTLFGRLTVTADARGEGVQYGGDAFTYRVGGVLAVPEAWGRLKASYGTAFRAPSLNDLFGIDSTGFVGNPNLKPERSTGWEAGFGVDVPWRGNPRLASLDVSYFDNRIRDLIQFQSSADFLSSTEVNIARAHTHGVETSLAVRPVTWFEAVGTWTYTEARDTTTGAQLLRRPRNRLTLDATVIPYPGLRVTPELVYTSRFADFLVNDNGFPGPVGFARSGTVINLTVTYDVKPKLQVFANARNINGSHYEPASGFATPGPSFLAGVRAGF